MHKHTLQKEKWTITFDPALKKRVRQEAKKMRIYPVQLLETLVRERLNPFGFQSVQDSVEYVNSVRKNSQTLSDKAFLNELEKWQRK